MTIFLRHPHPSKSRLAVSLCIVGAVLLLVVGCGKSSNSSDTNPTGVDEIRSSSSDQADATRSLREPAPEEVDNTADGQSNPRRQKSTRKQTTLRSGGAHQAAPNNAPVTPASTGAHQGSPPSAVPAKPASVQGHAGEPAGQPSDSSQRSDAGHASAHGGH